VSASIIVRMVEKGTERRSTATAGDMPPKYKGHVRVVRNSNLASPQGGSISPRNGAKQHLDGKSDGAGRKNLSRCTSVQSPVLLLSPSSRLGSPKLKGMASSPSSSSREGSPRTSPTLGCNYAGAKFSEPPSPASLPKPPPHWTDCFYISSGGFPVLNPAMTDKYREISQQLKVILKVPA